MVDLYCPPFVELIDRMRLEYPQQQCLFDLPARKWYAPPTGDDPPDLSVRFHGQRAGTPVGPASGPQTQMAQNLVLSWLAGARILELKTVQIDDQLRIGRPCIDAANVGYNIEFSQELRVADSLDQYVQGAMLIHMLRHAPEQFGHPFGETDWRATAGETVYDMSVGYDLASIQSDKVRRFIDGMRDAAPTIAALRRKIPRRLRRLRELDYPTRLSRSITLSTFHGCPADEIERICEFLLTRLEVDVIVKMNPPMLGQDALEHLLHETLGFHDIRVNPVAYTAGLQFDQALAMCRRLTALADGQGRRFGAKFSNTLEVLNHRSVFPADERVMYLSGPPLHVITLALAARFRRQLGPELGPKFPISFSAGVDRKNFANMVACGFVPVSTCTDLLKTGGYGRLPPYLRELERAMRAAGASTIDQYCLTARGGQAAAAADASQAGWLNTPIIARETCADPRYNQAHNRLVPKRIGSHLLLFDCITCNKCVPVCPNDANFLYETQPRDICYRDVEVGPGGSLTPSGNPRHFVLQRSQQIANYADFCNHCGNCDTFCPEWDGPYLKKPSFFGTRQSFDAGAPHDGFLLAGRPGRLSLWGRIDQQVCRLEELASERHFHYHDGTVTLVIDENQAIGVTGEFPPRPHRVDMGRYHALAALLAGIKNPDRVTQVNTRLLVAIE